MVRREAAEEISEPIRNVSIKARRILVGVNPQTSWDLVKEIVQLCRKLEELSDPKALASLIGEKLKSRPYPEKTPPNLPITWSVIAGELVDRYATERLLADLQYLAYDSVRKSIPNISSMILDMDPKFISDKTFEKERGTLHLTSDPGEPYALYSACPISGLIKTWANTYREALMILGITPQYLES